MHTRTAFTGTGSKEAAAAAPPKEAAAAAKQRQEATTATPDQGAAPEDEVLTQGAGPKEATGGPGAPGPHVRDVSDGHS